MEKPTKYQPPAAYTYSDIIKYIEAKYNIETRGYTKDEKREYRDYWHCVLKRNDGQVHREGCYISLFNSYGNDPEWVVEIDNMIKAEFPDLTDDDDRVWIEW